MTRRFWVGVVLSVPVLMLGMGGDLSRRSTTRSPPRPPRGSSWCWPRPVVLWAGWPFFERGWTSVRTMKLNMFTLIAMGTGVAWLFSVVATVAPGIFPDAFRHGRQRSMSTSRPRRSSPRWSCSGRCSSYGPASRPPERSGRCSTSPRRPRAGSTPTAPRRRSPSTRSRSVTGSGSAPARRCPVDGDRRGGPLLARRVAGHRRVDAGHQDHRRHRHRRHHQPDRRR